MINPNQPYMMKIMKLRIGKNWICNVLILFSLCIPFLSWSQVELTDYEHDPVPAPPTTAALGEYGFSPVNLSSGQLGLTVPIYTLSGQSLSLPITFSYRAGVKLKETSPYTGHGWSMLAGGVITRTVNGEVDPTPRIAKSIIQGEWSDEDAFDFEEGHVDAAPDVFNYNFMGYSGQFALEDDLATPYYVKEQRDWLLDVDFTGDITIVTEDGIKYVFSEKETTTVDNEESPYFDQGIVVSWHLSEIISATHDESIELTYYTENYGQKVKENNTLFLKPLGKTSYVQEQYSGDKYVSYESKKLDEITFKRGGVIVQKITFDATTTRNDIGTGTLKALSRISIFDDPGSTQSLKYFDLDITHDSNDERLFLRSIQEFSGDGSVSKPPFLFEYINENLLPSRLSYKEDHWGYYSRENGTQFPYSDKVKWRNALSKEPSATAEYGSLRKVTFPTGGYNLFYYENNEYQKGGNDESGESQETRYDVTKLLKLNWRGDEWYNYIIRAASNTETFDFSLAEDQFVELDMNLTLVKGANRNDNDLEDEIQEYRISVKDIDTNNEVFAAYFDYDPGSDDGIGFYITADSWVEQKHRAILEYDDPNTVPAHLFNQYFEYHQGSVLNSYYVSSPGLTAYQYYDEFLKNEYDGGDITVGEALDRILFLDLEAGNYRAEITTSSTIDNDMINNPTEISLELSFETSDVSLANEDDLIVQSDVALGGGIRIKSQVIGTGPDENILTYDYVIHDENGQPTSKTSGQISQEPHIIEYTPAAKFIGYIYINVIQDTGWWFPRSSGLPPSALWARVGGDWSPGYPAELNHAVAPHFDSYIKNTTLLYSIKSQPYQVHNSWVTYSEVKVTNGEEHDNAGFTIHKFHELVATTDNFYNTFYKEDATNFGFTRYGSAPPTITKGWPYNNILETNATYNRPKAVLEYKFRGIQLSPVLVKEENYEYHYITRNDWLLSTSIQKAFHVGFTGTSRFDRQYSLLKSKETITYDTDGNNPVSTITSYEYDSPNHQKATSVITINSLGDRVVKKTKYPQDYLSATSAGAGSSITMNTLQTKNIFLPVEEQIWKGSDEKGYHKLIDGRLLIYDEVSSAGTTNKRYQPIEISVLEVGPIENYNVTLPDFNTNSGFSQVDWISGNAFYNYEPNATIKYYENGNIKEVTGKDGVSTVYVWGYNYQYPIAKIENYSVAQITSTEQNLIDIAVNASNNDDSNTDENILRNTLRNLRNTPALVNSMVTTFTFDPIVGLTSVTDNNGYTTFYRYNKLNQLEQVEDDDGKVLSHAEYQYQGQ